jgi:hypothetical protein
LLLTSFLLQVPVAEELLLYEALAVLLLYEALVELLLYEALVALILLIPVDLEAL